jgi:hypothetical protein
MKRHIKKYLKRHFESDFALKGSSREAFPFDIIRLPNGYFKSFGRKNRDKIFYVIWRNHMGSGFFSNVSQVLCHLKIADIAGMIPVVDFKNFKTLYNENMAVHNTDNAWEYYFKPVSSFHLDEVYESQNVFFCSGEYPTAMGYNITKINGLYEEIYRKYIFLQNHVEEHLKDYLDKFDSRVLGIHFRGQEQKLAARHSFPPTEKQMIKYTDEIIEKYNIEKIFVVTEEQGYLDLFIGRYGEKVFYTDSYRTYQVNAYNLSPREKHRYLLGLNILIDAYLLSMCNGILCGDSNVSEFARFVNNKRFDFIYYIDNGVNSSNPLIARYLYGVKKRLPSNFGGLLNRIMIS